MPTRRLVAVPLLLSLVVPAAVSAQDAPPRPRRWAVEIFGGAFGESRSAGGTPLSQFPVGDAFTTEAGTPSRAHPSWRFGDGAALFNQVAARFGQITGRPFATITPLDEVLRAGGTSSGMRGTVGVRLSRTLTSRLSVDVLVERSDSGLTASDGVQQAMAAASDSFRTAFVDLLGTAPVIGLQAVSSVTPPTTTNSQLRVLGAISATIAEGPRWRVHGTVGGGVQRRGGDAAAVAVNGHYEFSLYGVAAFFERDEVVITFAESPSAGVGLLGLGATYDVTERIGVRLGIRAHLAANRARTTIETKPFITTGQTPDRLPTITVPAIQFSNQSTLPSSLRPAMASTLTTFTGGGLNRQIAITLGLVRRF